MAGSGASFHPCLSLEVAGREPHQSYHLKIPPSLPQKFANLIPRYRTMEQAKVLTSKASLVLDLPPSCVQFCPSYPNYLVVGTYNLRKQDGGEAELDAESVENKKPQSRNGSLVLFKTDGDTFTHIQTLALPSAILDLRFHPAEEHRDVFGVVSSTGTLDVFRIDPASRPESPVFHLNTSRCDDLDDHVLFLQFNWHPSDPRALGLTTSTGLARVVRLNDQWSITDSMDLDIQNSLEAWSIAFSPSTSDGSESRVTVYCGGDDSTLRYNTYQRQDGGDADSFLDASFASMTIKGQHEAGVTAILPLSLEDDTGGRLVVTGSYDDHIRLLAIYDLDKTYGMKRVKLLAEENLGGGVWRLDLVSQSDPGSEEGRVLLLASCMHAGSRIIEARRRGEGEGSQWEWRVLARFEEHKSMNYGSSFMAPVTGAGDGGGLKCVSTSFYDKLLCLWEY